jgi:hypothetical protein
MLHVCCTGVARGLRHLLAQHLPWVCAMGLRHGSAPFAARAVSTRAAFTYSGCWSTRPTSPMGLTANQRVPCPWKLIHIPMDPRALAPWSISRCLCMKEVAPLHRPLLLTTLRKTVQERDLVITSRPTQMLVSGWAERPDDLATSMPAGTIRDGYR